LKFSILISSFVLCLSGSAQNYRFEKISIEEGLSQSVVNAILQDQQGFIWLGTGNGLNRFDGYEFQVFKNDLVDSTSLSGNYISSLAEDQKGQLWIATTNSGLSKFDPVTERFTNYSIKELNSRKLVGTEVICLLVDFRNQLWIGTDLGLNRLVKAENTFVHYPLNTDSPDAIQGDYIKIIQEDSDGNIWMGTNDGLSKLTFSDSSLSFAHILHFEVKAPEPFVPIRGAVEAILFDEEGKLWVGSGGGIHVLDTHQLEKIRKGKHAGVQLKSYYFDEADVLIMDLLKEEDGKLWVATFGNGIKIIDTKTTEMFHFTDEKLPPYGLSVNDIYRLFKDNSGTMWIGTGGGGVNKLNTNTSKFSHWYKEANNANSLSNKKIWAILKDEENNIFIGTDGSGLDIFESEKGHYSNFASNPNDSGSISDNMILRIIEDHLGQKWLGTYGGGLNKYIPGKQPYFKNYKHHPTDSNSLSDNDIMSLMEDSKGNIWIGTASSGLNKFDPITEKFTAYRASSTKNSISSNLIMDIAEDEAGYLWLATDCGLNKFDPKTGNSILFAHQINDENSISTNDLYSLLIDEAGTLWIGTNGGGILKFDPVKEIVTHFTEKEGIANNTVYGILEGENDNLWASTNYGLSKFNKNTFRVKNYDVDDGIQSNEFSTFSYFKATDGQLFFGGINGLTGFYPHEIIDDTTRPNLIITKFQLLNTTVIPGLTNLQLGISEETNVILTKAISYTDTITISYLHNVFSFEFSALHFLNSHKNSYAYFLEGFDRDWIKTTAKNRRATYTNIDPGTYTFRVKGANRDGLWNEKEKSITLIITPPFWRRLWFYILAVGVVLLLILFIHHFRLKQVKLKAEKKSFKEKNKQKKVLLTEIHHRVKNNLQVVISLLNLQANTIDDDRVYLVFEEAQNRIVSMANLHDKMSHSNNLQHINVKIHFEELITELVKAYSIEKEITLTFNIDNINIGINTLVPLGLIINEVITNSLKYAFVDKTKGCISVDLKTIEENQFVLRISDDGIGLSDKVKEEHSKSLGTNIINLFVKRLKGSIERTTNSGAITSITFTSIDKI
jgi:ligand-binding sensor domain-containing protein/two-component sensor histidine kinase